MGPRKNLSLDRIWTHDLPNTGRTLYPLSHKNSRRARSFNWALTWLFSRSHTRVHYFHIYIFPVVWSYIQKTPAVKCRSITSINTQWILHQHFIGTLVHTQSTLHQHLGLIFNWCIWVGQHSAHYWPTVNQELTDFQLGIDWDVDQG